MINWIKTKYSNYKINKGRKRYDKNARELVSTKNIKDPFSSSEQYICLGDLFLESALDATALNNILEGYGITKLGEAIDPTSSPVLETLASIGKKSYFEDGFGNIISDPNHFPELVPKSNLYELQEYVNSNSWSNEVLGGYTAERNVKNSIESQGYEVQYPTNSNNEGYDLLVEQRWFEDNNLPFIKDSELSFVKNPTEMGVLEVKSSSGPELVLERFQNPLGTEAIEKSRIPIATPITDENSGSLLAYKDKIISFNDLGIDHNEILNVTAIDRESIAAGHFGFVDEGVEIDELSNAVDGYYGFDVPDTGGLDIPYIGLMITLFLSGSRSYKHFTGEQISFPKAVLNTSKDVATVGVASIGSMAVTDFVATDILGHTGGVTEVFSDAAGGGIGNLGDLEDVFEAGILIALGVFAFKQIKKIFGFTKENQFEELKVELHALNISYANLSSALYIYREDVIGYVEMLAKEIHIQRLNKINTKLDEMSLHGKKAARPLIFYFLKYTKAKQEQIISNIDENKYQFPHGKIELAIDRIKTLEDVRNMRHNGIAKTIKNIIRSIQDDSIINYYDKYKSQLLKPTKKNMPLVLESIIHAELSYIINIIDNIPIKPTDIIKNKLLPLIGVTINSLNTVRSIYDKLLKEGVISKENRSSFGFKAVAGEAVSSFPLYLKIYLFLLLISFFLFVVLGIK